MKTLDNILRDFDPKVKGQIMYFLVNASPHKPLYVATLNFVPEYATLCKLVLGNILCSHDPRVKIKSEKSGYSAMVYHRLQSSYNILLFIQVVSRCTQNNNHDKTALFA